MRRTIFNSRKRSTKTVNPNPVCTKIEYGRTKILIQIDNENFSTLEKIMELSCTPFEIGDYITFDDRDDRQLFDKQLKPKSFESKDFEYQLSADGKQIIEVSNKPLHYKSIKTKEELAIAIMFESRAKMNWVIVDSFYGFEPQVMSKKDFEEDYNIVST